MPPHGESVKPSLREVLAASHIAAVAIAVLLLWSLDSVFRALWDPVSRAATFLFTAVAILDVPYYSHTLTAADRLTLITTFAYLFSAFIDLTAAWLLSHWTYGVGPIKSLSKYRVRLAGGNHV
jgi:uncharacterized membrane protein